MKKIKCILCLLLVIVLLFTSACTDNNVVTSSDAPESVEQSTSKDISTEISEEKTPKGFNDEIAYGYHTLGNSMYGDVMFEYEGEHKLCGITKKTGLILEYFDTNSSIYKAYTWLGEKVAFLEDKAKGKKDIPLADFENVYSAKYQFDLKQDSPIKPQTFTYEEVREKDAPIFMFLETAPLTESTVKDIQTQYGVNEEKAVSIYRQMVIDKLRECGLYVEGFADIYSYDTLRACFIASTDRDVKFNLEDFKHEDSVYTTCTHLFFAAYGKCADIEALETAINSEENKLLKVRAMAASGCGYDTGKSAYIVEDTKAYAHNYYSRAEIYLVDLAKSSLGVLTEF